MARPSNAKNSLPSKADQRVMLQQLRHDAEQGDSLATFALLFLTRHDELMHRLKNERTDP